MAEKLVFSYTLRDSALYDISQIDVYADSPGNNIRAVRYGDHVWLDKKEFSYLRTQTLADVYAVRISKDKIRRIQDIIKQHDEIFSVRKEISYLIEDGRCNLFTFSSGRKTVQIHAHNISCFGQFPKTLKDNFYGKDAPEAEIVLSLFHEIENILIEYGVDRSFLMLD